MTNNDLLRLEALLFAYGKYVEEEELSKILNIKDLNSALKKLQDKYNTLETAIKLVQNKTSWKLTVKDEYLDLVKNIVTKTELDRPTMETLAVIAFKNPILQTEVIKARGSGAYEYIKNLLETGYITKEKSGRSFKLRLTQKFFDYFDLPEDKVKEFFSQYEEVDKNLKEKEKINENLKKELEKQEEIKKQLKENQQLSNYSEE
ncbi:SMC-Scp complex subunit ScpB [Candidatus Woesearchaeota archaeon]|nr:SMC-Scp complex subunit ScpB [Candidatus Woesearchaeota archaeon]